MLRINYRGGMKMKKFYAIKDTKADFYHHPNLLRNKGEVMRAVGNAINSDKGELAANPEDYSLFEVGEFDEQTGMIKGYENKIHVCDLTDLKQEQPTP